MRIDFSEVIPYFPKWVVRLFFSKKKAKECLMTSDDNGCSHCDNACDYNKDKLKRTESYKLSRKYPYTDDYNL